MMNNDYFNQQFHCPLLSMIARVHVMSDWKLYVHVNNMTYCKLCQKHLNVFVTKFTCESHMFILPWSEP